MESSTLKIHPSDDNNYKDGPSTSTSHFLTAPRNLPSSWSQVKLTQVPLQHDEDGYGEEVVEEVVTDTPILDPLGLSPIDLRVIAAQKGRDSSCVYQFIQ